MEHLEQTIFRAAECSGLFRAQTFEVITNLFKTLGVQFTVIEPDDACWADETPPQYFCARRIGTDREYIEHRGHVAIGTFVADAITELFQE